MILPGAIWENRGSVRRCICLYQLVPLPSSSRKNEYETPFRHLPRNHAHPRPTLPCMCGRVRLGAFVADSDIVVAHVSRHSPDSRSVGVEFPSQRGATQRNSIATDPT